MALFEAHGKGEKQKTPCKEMHGVFSGRKSAL